MRFRFMILAVLCPVLFAGAETVLFSRAGVGRIAFDAPVPVRAVSAGDLADGEISFWVTATNAANEGWSWTIPVASNILYLTDGETRSGLRNVTHPGWDDLGPQRPGSYHELKFALPPGMDRSRLRIVCSTGVFVWGGHVEGPVSVEVWKGVRAEPSAWVDAANRCCFVDVTGVPATRYEYTFPGEQPFASDAPVCRRRLPPAPKPFTVRVRAFTRKDGVFTASVPVVPRARPLAPPLPVEKVLVGQCVYDDDARFRDEIVTNRLANLIVGWGKASDYTNLPPAIERRMAADDVHFLTIYGNDTRATTDRLRTAWNQRYLENNIGEFSGYLYQGPEEAAACHVPQGQDLATARNRFIDQYVRPQVIDQHRRYGYVFSTSGSPLGTYELQGGMDFMCCELYAVGAHNLAYATSEMRGAARKWGPEYWGGWLAEEWQTFPVPYGSKQKYDLLAAGLYQQYLMGTSLIVLESGAQSTQAEKYTAGCDGKKQPYDGPAPTAYRRTVKEFHDWVAVHPRAHGTPETPIALVLGNNDGYVGMVHGLFAVWGQHETAATNKNWKYSAPEQTWATLQDVFFPIPADALAPSPNFWLAGTPYGQVDIVNIDDETRSADLVRYRLLVYAGWNTMTPRILRLLDAYVRAGGELVIAVPHFSTRVDREFARYSVADLIHGGDLRPLVDASILRREGDAAVLSVPVPSDGVLVQKHGKGTVRLMTSWLYPGSGNSRAAAYARLAAIRAAAVPRVAVLSGDDAKYISCAVYSSAIYLLNIDCVASRTVHVDGVPVTLKPLEMRILPRTGGREGGREGGRK